MGAILDGLVPIRAAHDRFFYGSLIWQVADGDDMHQWLHARFMALTGLQRTVDRVASERLFPAGTVLCGLGELGLMYAWEHRVGDDLPWAAEGIVECWRSGGDYNRLLSEGFYKNAGEAIVLAELLVRRDYEPAPAEAELLDIYREALSGRPGTQERLAV